MEGRTDSPSSFHLLFLPSLSLAHTHTHTHTHRMVVQDSLVNTELKNETQD